ncbi:MAG: sigma-70 family RNA polymerase sigma factor [Bacteroidales bacterium]|nr:sigma-70 family RNA polymerase sigma factor [Bacteroidales bacterium]
MRSFYDRYAGYLTAVCSRYVVDRADVKDILQEAFVKIFQSLERFQYRGEGSVRAWAARIVVNDSLKSLRASSRLSFVDDLPDIPEDDEPSLPQVPPAVIQEMIKALPDGYRTVFNLFVFEKKSHREIASLLGIKEDSSASQFFRARALLAKNIKNYLKEHDK